MSSARHLKTAALAIAIAAAHSWMTLGILQVGYLPSKDDLDPSSAYSVLIPRHGKFLWMPLAHPFRGDIINIMYGPPSRVHVHVGAYLLIGINSMIWGVGILFVYSIIKRSPLTKRWSGRAQS